MKTSLVISIALFAAFLIPDISCREICSELSAECNKDSQCCSGKCSPPDDKTQKYCIEKRAYGYDDVRVEHGMCSYNKTFADVEHEALFEFFGLNAAHHTYPTSTKLQLTLNNNNKTPIDIVVNNVRPQYNSTVLELSKEAAEALNITEEGLTPCSVIIYEPEPDYSTIKNILGISGSFFVVSFLVMTFL